MNIGVETEKIEFKKTTGELREGITSLASMLNKNGYGVLHLKAWLELWDPFPGWCTHPAVGERPWSQFLSMWTLQRAAWEPSGLAAAFPERVV